MVRRVIAKLCAAVVVLGCLMGALAPGVAAAEDDFLSSAQLLGRYGIVKGDERGLRPGDSITRAEVAKIVVLSLGLESEARQFKGRGGFPDTFGHWAEGYIVLARRQGLLKGYPEGDFRPENPVMYAEVLTLLARMLGLDPSSEPWPFTYLAPAVDAGIVPDDLNLGQKLDEPAIRADVFVMLKRTIVDVKNTAGKSIAQLYLDKVAPRITLDPQPGETESATLTVTGMVKDADRVKVNGTETPLDDGYFQTDVKLRVGPNTIRIQAWDDVGNASEQTAQVVRKPGSAASIDLTGPGTVAAGGTGLYRIALWDQNGVEIPDRHQIEAQVNPTLGTFDPVTGKFTAGMAAGRATIILTAGTARATLPVEVTAGALDRLGITPAELSLTPGDTYTFTASGLDPGGNPIPVSGVSWSATTGTIDAGGLFRSSDAGAESIITASLNGKTATAVVHPLNYKAAGVRLSQPAGVMIANKKAKVSVTATVVDAAGATLKEYQGSLTLTSSAPMVAAPVSGSVTVRDGVATFEVQAGTTPGKATITATSNLGKSGTAAVSTTSQVLTNVRLSGRVVQGTDSGIIEAVALDQEMNPIVSALPQAAIIRLTAASDTGVPAAGNFTFKHNHVSVADIVLSQTDPASGDVRAQYVADFQTGTGTWTINGTPVAGGDYGVLSGALVTGVGGRELRLAVEQEPGGNPAAPVIPNTMAGQVRQIYVKTLDSAGVPVTSGPELAGLSLQLQDNTGRTWSPVVSPSEGHGRARFDVTQTKADDHYTYTITLLPGGDAVTTTETRVFPGPLAAVTLKAPPAMPADGITQAALTAELQDAYGNHLGPQFRADGTTVNPPTYGVTFTKVLPQKGATQDFPELVVQSDVSGVATATVTAGRVVGSETYRVSVDNPNSPGDTFRASATVTTRGAADHLTILYGDNNGDGREGGSGDNEVPAGNSLRVITEVRDAHHNVVTYDEATGITLTVRGPSGAETGPYESLTSGDGRAAFLVPKEDLGAAGRYAIRAQRPVGPGQAEMVVRAYTAGYGGILPDAVVSSGRGTGLVAGSDLAVLPAAQAGGTAAYAWVTVSLADAQGNPAVNSTGAAVYVTLSTGRITNEVGYFTVDSDPASYRVQSRTVAIDRNKPASNPVKFFAGDTAGLTTITATTADGRIATVNVNTVAPLPADHLAFTQLQPYPAATNGISRAVTAGQDAVVTVQDAGNVRAAAYGQADADLITVMVEGSAYIVAAWDAGRGEYVTKYGTPGSGPTGYPQTVLLRPDRGQVKVRLQATLPGTYVVRASGPAPLVEVVTTAEFR